MVALTLQKALPDLVYIALSIMLVLPILAVVLCLFETHHDDGFFTYRGQHRFTLNSAANVVHKALH